MSDAQHERLFPQPDITDPWEEPRISNSWLFGAIAFLAVILIAVVLG